MIAEGLLLVVLGATNPVAPTEAMRWSRIQVGIPRAQVSDILGEPLMRNAARGYERWVYDSGCEVQFTRGEVSAWTAPKNVPPPALPVSRRDSSLGARRT